MVNANQCHFLLVARLLQLARLVLKAIFQPQAAALVKRKSTQSYYSQCRAPSSPFQKVRIIVAHSS
jgi:hypothetical protein